MPASRRPRQAKRVQPAKTIERQGVALINAIVSDMGHLWNEPQNDFGTDGYIELVDPKTHKASSRIVLVQSKATSVAFGERPIGFTCEEDDLRYWLNGNAPVILIRSHPANRKAYWVSVKDYFASHPEHRESRRIVFDRDSDRFDASCGSALWDLSRPLLDGLHLGTPPVHESLITNLLPIEAFPDAIYVATPRFASPRRHEPRLRTRPAGGRGTGSCGRGGATASRTPTTPCSRASAPARFRPYPRASGPTPTTRTTAGDLSGC
jgi:hypothetical protein